MLNPLFLPLFVATGFLFASSGLHAQKIERLQYRYEIGDIDGIGELTKPLFAEVVSAEGSSLTVPQKHLIAIAAMKFRLATGDHSRAILPYLVALHLQREIEQTSSHPLVDLVDESFRKKHLPPVFFSQDRSDFQTRFKLAVAHGACLETELSAAYEKAGADQQSPEQQKIVKAIMIAKENPQPQDREILKLIDNYVAHLQQHPTLAHESLATAIEGLRRLERDAEADRLNSVFRTQFPDSRRLDR